ncbi:MAG TPA: alpha/beta hydrolase [Flavobacteriales bacterium]|nr:alpha/beta hydrolase [Flavobacteriales bacterium]
MKKSHYKTPTDLEWFQDWEKRVLAQSSIPFQHTYAETNFGKTHIYTHNAENTNLPAVFCLPGMRTSGAYWILNNSMVRFKNTHRIFILDNIGQPGLSAGTNPNVKTSEYGKWIKEVLAFFNIEKAFFIGASFGCQLIVKLSQVAPSAIEKACFICPGGINQIGMTWKNLSSNMFLIWFKNEKRNQQFISNVIYGSTFKLTGKAHELLSESVLETVKRFVMKTGLPYPAKKEEFANMKMPLLVLPGQDDPMFPPAKLLKRIQEVFPVQPKFEVLEGHGHGSECSPTALQKAYDFLN